MTISSTPKVLLINPPVTLPSEPPAGIARLAGALREHEIDCRVLDLSFICLLAQFDKEFLPEDRWSSRAWKNRRRDLAKIRSSRLYDSPDRYQRTVSDLSRILNRLGRESGSELSFSNYSDSAHSPLVSADLLACAERFEQNFFYHRFGPLLSNTLGEYSPDYVGVSLSYLSQALTGFSIIGFLRHRFPSLKIIAGGGLITSWMSSPAWKEPFAGLIDACISGPGEDALLELCGKKSRSKLGCFNFDGFELSSYLAPGVVLPYGASHGCYWQKCSFCPDFAEGSCYRAQKPASAHAEIRDLAEQHNPVLVHLLDNAVSPSLLRALAADPIGVPWYGFARFEKDLADPDFCRALKKSGCVMLKLGLESGSQRVLDQLNKGVDLQRAAKILTNLEAVGIAAYVYLLFGTPAETEADALLTMDFVRCHHRAITFFNLAIFNMPVCSPEAVHLEKRFSDGDLSLYCDFNHPGGWDRKTVRNFLQKRFRRDPLINEIDKRNPGPFGSNHAPFFI